VTSSAQTNYALRVLRCHCLSNAALQLVDRATVVVRLTFAASTWRGLTKTSDRQRINSVIDRARRLKYCSRTCRRLMNCVINCRQCHLATLSYGRTIYCTHYYHLYPPRHNAKTSNTELTPDCCRLDYCNSLLTGVNDDLFRRLQSVQNAAARLVF